MTIVAVSAVLGAVVVALAWLAVDMARRMGELRSALAQAAERLEDHHCRIGEMATTATATRDRLRDTDNNLDRVLSKVGLARSARKAE